MAEDTSVQTSDADIQDVSLIDTPIAPKDDAPSEPADQGANEAADTQEADTTDASEAKDTEAIEQTAQTAEAPQETADQAKIRAQQEYQNRQRTRQQIADQLDQTFGPKTEEQLIEEGIDPTDAKIQAIREEMAYERQRGQISELNADMTYQSSQLLQELPVYNPSSKEYDKDFTDMVDNMYFQAARIQTETLGTNPDGSPRQVITNAEVPLYDYYQKMAQIYGRGASKGTQQGQQEALQMLARTENVGGSSAAGNSSDALADLEERLGDVVIT